MDHYHLTLPEIADLTDRSISSIYFHARTKEGYIQVPVAPLTSPTAKADAPVVETEETVIRDLTFLRDSHLITQQNYEECVQKAREKFRGAEVKRGD